MSEQLYQFIDKSGTCFKTFQSLGNIESEKIYQDLRGASLRASNDGNHNFSVGDMFCLRDELEDAGFKWGTDFYIKKVGK